MTKVESKYARKKRLQQMQVAEYERGEHDEMIREYDRQNAHEHVDHYRPALEPDPVPVVNPNRVRGRGGFLGRRSRT